MTLKEMEDLLDSLVQDDSLSPKFRGMINDTILELALNYDFPTLKVLNPWEVAVDNSSWIWPLPSEFHKKIFRAAYTDDSGRLQKITVHTRRDDIEYRDHTATGARVTAVAHAREDDSEYLLIDPLPTTAQTLLIWGFKRPNVLVLPTDTCKCIPAEFHEKVIISKVVKDNYRLLMDQVVNLDLKPIQFWDSELTKGLKGGIGEGPGLLNYFNLMTGGSRRTGGPDPVSGYNLRVR